MSLTLRIKSLIICFFLFFGAVALINYKLLSIKNMQKQSGYTFRNKIFFREVVFGEQRKASHFSIGSKFVTHSNWLDDVTSGSYLQRPVNETCFSGNSTQGNGNEKNHRHRTKGLPNSFVLLPVPQDVSVIDVKYFEQRVYFISSQEFCREVLLDRNSLRGPPTGTLA